MLFFVFYPKCCHISPKREVVLRVVVRRASCSLFCMCVRSFRYLSLTPSQRFCGFDRFFPFDCLTLLTNIVMCCLCVCVLVSSFFLCSVVTLNLSSSLILVIY